MRLRWALGVVLVLAMMVVVNAAFSLMSQADDLDVAAGVALLLVLVVVGPLGFRLIFYKRKKEEVQ